MDWLAKELVWHRTVSAPARLPEGILGQGGMAIVYKARDLDLRRPVAVKMLLAGA